MYIYIYMYYIYKSEVCVLEKIRQKLQAFMNIYLATIVGGIKFLACLQQIAAVYITEAGGKLLE